MAEWSDIATAPKDGTHILVARRRPDRDNHGALLPADVVIAAWLSPWGVAGGEEWVGITPTHLNGDRSCVSLSIGGTFATMFPGVGPTHWMPLPPPPAGSGDESK